MSATNEKLETLFGKVRSLPKERQEAAIEALADIASEPYELSASELAVLKPALERAGRGEWASDAEVSELLDKTWREAGSAPLERGLLKRVTDIHQMANAFRKLLKLALALGIGAIEALPACIGRDKEGRFAQAAIMEAVRVPHF